MLNPVSTYRIQFHKGFSFAEFSKILSYLKELGIGTLYASPVFEAVPGSNHGYDGLNPHKINPEIGTLDQLRDISTELKTSDINWLQDIVPNHMGYHPQNNWLMDVMENGAESKYAKFFDIDWREKLMVPFLGSDLNQVIANKELKIISKDGKQYIQYYDSIYPLKTSSSINENVSEDELKKILEEQNACVETGFFDQETF